MYVQRAIRSARFYFWPIIAGNLVTMELAVGGGSAVRVLAFSLVISCLASFGFMLNDICDQDVDKVNRPRRFNNAGPASAGISLGCCASFLLMALTVAYLLGPTELEIAIGLALALTAYSVLLRRFLLIPTLLAAALSASPIWAPLILCGKTVESAKLAFVLAIVVVLAAREILMDVRDCPGDIAGKRETLAIVFGQDIAKYVGVLLAIAGSTALGVIVASALASLTMGSRIAAAAVGTTVLYLLISSSIRTLLVKSGQESALQTFVYRSRAVMALIPLLNLLIWQYSAPASLWR